MPDPYSFWDAFVSWFWILIVFLFELLVKEWRVVDFLVFIARNESDTKTFQPSDLVIL